MKAFDVVPGEYVKPPPALTVGMPLATAFCSAGWIAFSSTGQ